MSVYPLHDLAKVATRSLATCFRPDQRGACYHLRTAGLPAQQRWVANHDSGLKRVGVELHGLSNVVIDGEGARLVVHGRVLPFWLENCKQVTLRNFVLDWDRPFVSHGLVEAVGRDWVDVRIDSALFPHRVADGRLVFTGDDYRSDVLHNMLAFDPKTQAPVVGTQDQYPCTNQGRAEARPGGLVRWVGPWGGSVQAGELMTFQHDDRDCPGIVLSGCRDMRLEDITIHHAGGMGVLAQRCEDVTLRRVQVMVEPGSPRVVSTFNDATHFVGCRGTITLNDCRFESQLDDATNVHGVYTQLAEADGCVARVSLQHFQQAGFRFAEPGDQLLLRDKQTLAPLGESRVKAVCAVDACTIALTLDTPLPALDAAFTNYIFSNESWQPNATIQNCLCQKNRARGFLLSTAGRVRVIGNTFRTLGTAVGSYGGCTHWFESGPARDVLIQNNFFDHCFQNMWGKAVIAIAPFAGRNLMNHSTPVHQNIRITGNTFVGDTAPLLLADSVRGLTVTDNRLSAETSSNAGPLRESCLFDITANCTDVRIDGNHRRAPHAVADGSAQGHVVPQV